MTIYLVVLLLIFYSSRSKYLPAIRVKLGNTHTHIHDSYSNRRLMQIEVAAFLFIFLLTFRHTYYGYDGINYLRIFEAIETPSYYIKQLLNFEIANESLFYLFFSIIKYANLDLHIAYFIEALLQLTVVGVLVYKYAKNPWKAFIFYFLYGFFVFTTTQRQSMAISFNIIAYLFAKNKKLVKYLTFCFIAILFHKSAIVFLPAYWLINIKPSKKLIYIFFVIFFILNIYGFLIFLNTTVFFLGKPPGELNENEARGLAYLPIIMFSFFLPLFVKKKYRYNIENWGLVVAMMLLFPISLHVGWGARIYFVYRIFLILYLPNTLEYVNKPYKKMFTIITYLYGVAFFYFVQVRGANVLPYKFFFQYVRSPKYEDWIF